VEHPAEHLDPIGQTAEACSAGGVGAAAAIVLDRDPDPTAAGRQGHRDLRCGGVLRDVRERFGADEVRDRLDVRR
jgi:hypothetical protein